MKLGGRYIHFREKHYLHKIIASKEGKLYSYRERSTVCKPYLITCSDLLSQSKFTQLRSYCTDYCDWLVFIEEFHPPSSKFFVRSTANFESIPSMFQYMASVNMSILASLLPMQADVTNKLVTPNAITCVNLLVVTKFRQ